MIDSFNDGVRAAAEWFTNGGWALDPKVFPSRLCDALLRPEAAESLDARMVRVTNAWGDDTPGRIPDYD